MSGSRTQESVRSMTEPIEWTMQDLEAFAAIAATPVTDQAGVQSKFQSMSEVLTKVIKEKTARGQK